MGRANSRRIDALQAVTLFICIVIAIAAAILHPGVLNGAAGFAFFLLIVGSLLYIAIGVSVSVWRLMTRVLPSSVGIPERLLVALSSFVLVVGCGPLALYLAVWVITHVEGSIGASGMWALLAIFVSVLFCTFAAAIFVGRAVLDRLHARRSRYSA